MPSVDDLKLLSSGKVREVYQWDDDLLMVASDRISTYDVVMPTPIPDKGKVLNRMSVFWFGLTGDIVPNHFISEDVPEEAVDRGMRVKRLQMYPVECVVRGYLTGSGWKEYKEGGAVCGIELPPNLLESDKLPEPIFTPSTKAAVGDHDENVSFDAVVALVGEDMANAVRKATLEIYAWAAAYAAERGVIIADTKFEFGTDENGVLHIMDEMLTPDSSRFWPADTYQPGKAQDSYDKQYVRDYLEEIRWNKQPPAPALPQDVARRTSEKYLGAYRQLTGRELEIY